MITTAEFKDIQATLIHRITGGITIDEAGKGADILVKTLDRAVNKSGTINLIINTKGVNFTSLTAHRTWSQALDNFPAIRKKINYCAFVLDDTPNGRAEKKFMDSERLKFFFDFNEAVHWLRNRTGF